MTYAHNSPSFSIKERRQKVQLMDARSMIESAIASELGVDQATISRDLKAIREDNRRFVYQLAKVDLSHYFKQRLDSLDETKRRAWEIFNNISDDNMDVNKTKLLALKLIITADEASIKLLSEGPTRLTLMAQEERLTQLENA